jgi:hypothetical protein
MIFTNLGGFVAGVSGILVERYREKRRKKAEHFRDIKHLCLEPMLRRLEGLKERLMSRNCIGYELDLELGEVVEERLSPKQAKLTGEKTRVEYIVR